MNKITGKRLKSRGMSGTRLVESSPSFDPPSGAARTAFCLSLTTGGPVLDDEATGLLEEDEEGEKEKGFIWILLTPEAGLGWCIEVARALFGSSARHSTPHTNPEGQIE